MKSRSFALYFFVRELAAVAAKGPSIDLAALPWEELSSSLPSSSGSGQQLIDATYDAWAADCIPPFAMPAEDRSTYLLIDQPSGLCMAMHWCIFERCCPDRPYLGGESTYLNWAEKFDVLDNIFLEYITSNFYEETAEDRWHDPSHPWLEIPHKTLFPKVAGDVVAAINFAKEHGIELSIKNSGHSLLGSSTKKDTLLLNMNQYKRYASDDMEAFGVTDCTDTDYAAQDMDADLRNQPCKLSIAKGKPGVIRVGGGENWDKTYRAVKAANEAVPGGYKYHVVGGNSATVSPMGWTWSGGLSASTGGRIYGFGVDQVVQIEAVLPNGQHVRFGPTEWETVDGYLCSKTTAVSGVCCSNSEDPNEDRWIWSNCSQSINFDDLWFAFRGGGGGTWGVVLSVHLQLHDYLPYDAVYITFENEQTARIFSPIEPLLARFVMDYMVDPKAIGVTKEESNACGSPAPASSLRWWCYGEGSGAAFVNAFSQFMSSNNETLAAKGLSEEDMDHAQSGFMAVHNFEDFASEGLFLNEGTPHEGKVKDDGANLFWSNMEGELDILVPKSWILKNKERFIEVLLRSPLHRSGNLYYAYGGDAEFSHDQTTSLSSAHREAGFMFNLKDSLGQVDYNELLQEMYDFSATEFPAYLGANHLGPSAYGPLKSDWTKPCPLTFTRTESEEQCVTAQEAVWGGETLQRLEAIKKAVDPDGMLDCFRCIGHVVSFKEQPVDPPPVDIEPVPSDDTSEEGESPPATSVDTKTTLEESSGASHGGAPACALAAVSVLHTFIYFV